MTKLILPSILLTCCLTASALAQTADPNLPAPKKAAAETPDTVKRGAPASLTVYFDAGSTTVRNMDRSVLDKASRAYSEGKPIVMILTGGADRTGQAEDNLKLSQRRAAVVLQGLIDRGIPADRFQVLAKGETDLPVPTAQGVAEPQNRRVDITWR